MKVKDGARCSGPATHRWGNVPFCCAHFDELIVAMFDLNEGIAEQRHRFMVAIFEKRRKDRNEQDGSLLSGAPCIDPPGGGGK